MAKNSIFYIFFMVFYAIPSLGVAQEDFGLGRLADTLMGPVVVMSDFIVTGSLLIGTVFLFASLIRYVEHRRNPLMVPISTVIFLLIAGQVLILLPMLSMFVEGGVPYTFFK